jgi:hypothetical protein
MLPIEYAPVEFVVAELIRAFERSTLTDAPCTAAPPFSWVIVPAIVPFPMENGTPLLLTPPTDTMTLPVVAATGTGTTIVEFVQFVGAEDIPLNETVLAP